MLSPDLASFTLRWVDDTEVDYPATSVETLTMRSTPANVSISATSSPTSRVPLRFYPSSRGSSCVSCWHRLRSDGRRGRHEPDRHYFTNWALTEAGLKITFPEFQVGDATVGTPFVVISWSDLKLVMRPDGPVSRLAGFPAAPDPSGREESGGPARSPRT